jgi:hypothetical protein
MARQRRTNPYGCFRRRATSKERNDFVRYYSTTGDTALPTFPDRPPDTAGHPNHAVRPLPCLFQRTAILNRFHFEKSKLRGRPGTAEPRPLKLARGSTFGIRRLSERREPTGNPMCDLGFLDVTRQVGFVRKAQGLGSRVGNIRLTCPLGRAKIPNHQGR